MDLYNTNKCSTCGAKNGRCGLLYSIPKHKRKECINCHETRKNKEITIDNGYPRTEEELQKTFNILNKEQ